VKRTIGIVGIFAVVALVATTAFAYQAKPDQKDTINVPPEEAKAYEPIEKALTPEEALTAAKAFIAKYPKSAALPQVEIAVFNKIIDTPKDDKRLANIEAFKQTFPASALGLDLDYSMISYWLEKSDFAKINGIIDAYLVKHPDDVRANFLGLSVAIDALKKQDGSLVASGKAHGAKAIAVFEGTALPSGFKDDAEWKAWKTTNEPVAYQSYGIIGLVTGDDAMAGANFQKAIAVNAADPFNYMLLANVEEGKYDALAKKFNDAPDKKAPDAVKMMEAANAQMDEVIRLLAKAVALADGSTNPQYQAILAQAKPALEAKYKQRHNNLNGLDAMIKAAKAPNK